MDQQENPTEKPRKKPKRKKEPKRFRDRRKRLDPVSETILGFVSLAYTYLVLSLAWKIKLYFGVFWENGYQGFWQLLLYMGSFMGFYMLVFIIRQIVKKQDSVLKGIDL